MCFILNELDHHVAHEDATGKDDSGDEQGRPEETADALLQRAYDHAQLGEMYREANELQQSKDAQEPEKPHPRQVRYRRAQCVDNDIDNDMCEDMMKETIATDQVMGENSPDSIITDIGFIAAKHNDTEEKADMVTGEGDDLFEQCFGVDGVDYIDAFLSSYTQ